MNIYTKPEFEIIEIPVDADVITLSGDEAGGDLPETPDDEW